MSNPFLNFSLSLKLTNTVQSLLLLSQSFGHNNSYGNNALLYKDSNRPLMTDSTVNQIKHALKESLNWSSDNLDSLNFHRLEGTLHNPAFKTELLNQLSRYESEIKRLRHAYVCGFEIEFYLAPDKIPKLEQDIAEMLPDYQMLLVCLDKVPQTNHRNFYLIQETTGEPPENMLSYELVSPKLDPKSLPYFIHHFFKLLHKHGAKDNHAIGFHLHVSTRDDLKVSPIALLLFLDENGLLDNEERKYSRDIIKQFFSYKPDNWAFIFKEITRKCYNVNLLYYQDHNHIELRSIGGSGYLDSDTAIIEHCFQCLLSYEQSLTTAPEEIAKKINQKYPLQQSMVKIDQQDYTDLLESDDKEHWHV